MNRWIGLIIAVGFLAGCGKSANVEEQRQELLRLDREWGATTKDIDRFVSNYAADATVYAPGMPLVTGSAQISDAFKKMSSAPAFALTFAPIKADVSASGEIGYTTGTYQMGMNGIPEKGKYVAIWKKQPAGQWKVAEDIFNADSSDTPATAHVMVPADKVAWGPAPPFLPPGSRMAVISGDPSKPGPFAIRAQVPAGYKVPPHWHPGDENLTILSGTVALGMGDSWDESKMETLGSGGFAALPAEMHHSFLAKTAATFQVHGMGPFAITYVNPGDNPMTKK